MGPTPCINQAIQELLIHGFSTLNTHVPDQKHKQIEFVVVKNSFTMVEKKTKIKNIGTTQSIRHNKV